MLQHPVSHWVLSSPPYYLNVCIFAVDIAIYLIFAWERIGRPWPVFFGTGIGLGMGYSNCQNDFRSPYVQAHPLPLTKTVGLLSTVRRIFS